MSGVLDQQAQGKKPGRAKGDHGTKKLAAVGADVSVSRPRDRDTRVHLRILVFLVIYDSG